MGSLHFWIKLLCLFLFIYITLVQASKAVADGCLDRKPESDPICGKGKKRYTFNSKKGRCSSFMHHGCRKSRNVFRTRTECQRACACNIDLDQGHWCGGQEAYRIRYYWENKSRLCRPFWYSGCGGNHNRFASIDYCKRVCRRD